MPDKKLTDSEIVKALEWCARPLPHCYCDECPAGANGGCAIKTENIIDLINSLKSDKEYYKKNRDKYQDNVMFLSKQCDELQAENKSIRKKSLLEAASKFAGHSNYHGDTILCKLICMAEGKEVATAKPLDMSEIKAEAYKEFAERLKENSIATFSFKGVVMVEEIDNLLKEMVGDC